LEIDAASATPYDVRGAAPFLIRPFAATESTGMADFAQWLNGLPLGVMMRRLHWLFPLLQTLHILATGLVMSAAIMISLRLWRVSKTHGIAARAHRYLPWIWWSLVVLALSGVALIVGNPRILRDPALPVKLWMTAAATVVTIVLALMMRGGERFEKRAGGHLAMSVAAAAALTLWLGATFLGRGRWIFNFIG
jgi:cytochrome bd-type quinol oxidase subunit 2